MFQACFGSTDAEHLDPDASPRVTLSPPMPAFTARSTSPASLPGHHQTDEVRGTLALVNEALRARDGPLACYLLSQLCLGETEDSQPQAVRELIARSVGRAHLLLGDMCKNHFLPVETLFNSIPNEPMVVAVLWHSRGPPRQPRRVAAAAAPSSNSEDDHENSTAEPERAPLAGFKPLTESDLAKAIQGSLDIPIASGAASADEVRLGQTKDGLGSYPITFLKCRPRTNATTFAREYHADLVMLVSGASGPGAPPTYFVDRLRGRRRTYFAQRMDEHTAVALVFPRSVFDRPEDSRVLRFFDTCASFFA